ncbi:MAG: PDZ domain-containing protein, partial [Alphaproteobacteria bacterium]|nr:PDZ domain-containing protein [Alphaproteobacteria bacterium]
MPLTILLRAAILAVVLLVPSRWALAQPGYVGIQIQPMTEEVAKAHRWKGTEGVFVREVYRNGPGETAGLQAGDIIVTFDGATVQ